MATDTKSGTMTFEEIYALPNDGIERELIRGELRERPTVTRRNQWHSRVEPQIAALLLQWLKTQPKPRGQVVSGEAGFRLRKEPETGVGIDVAYVSSEIITATPKNSPFFEGPPVLAVEILSPSDTQEDIDDKIAVYLETGVRLVWIVNPRFQTVTVYQPGSNPQMFSADQELSAEPHLPGFRVSVAALFDFE